MSTRFSLRSPGPGGKDPAQNPTRSEAGDAPANRGQGIDGCGWISRKPVYPFARPVRNEVKRWPELGERSGRSIAGRSRGLRKGSVIPRRLSHWKAKRSQSGSPNGHRGSRRSSPFVRLLSRISTDLSKVLRETPESSLQTRYSGKLQGAMACKLLCGVKDLIADGSTEGRVPSGGGERTHFFDSFRRERT